MSKKGKLDPAKTKFNIALLSTYTEAKFKIWFDSLFEGDAKEWHAKIKKMKP